MRREGEDTIMRKFASITKDKWVFAAVMAIACVWGTNSYAQSDADAVKAAVAAYTAAVDLPTRPKWKRFGCTTTP